MLRHPGSTRKGPQLRPRMFLVNNYCGKNNLLQKWYSRQFKRIYLFDLRCPIGPIHGETWDVTKSQIGKSEGNKNGIKQLEEGQMLTQQSEGSVKATKVRTDMP